jgi:hypothetical protein
MKKFNQIQKLLLILILGNNNFSIPKSNNNEKKIENINDSNKIWYKNPKYINPKSIGGVSAGVGVLASLGAYGVSRQRSKSVSIKSKEFQEPLRQQEDVDKLKKEDVDVKKLNASAFKAQEAPKISGEKKYEESIVEKEQLKKQEEVIQIKDVNIKELLSELEKKYEEKESLNNDKIKEQTYILPDLKDTKIKINDIEFDISNDHNNKLNIKTSKFCFYFFIRKDIKDYHIVEGEILLSSDQKNDETNVFKFFDYDFLHYKVKDHKGNRISFSVPKEQAQRRKLLLNISNILKELRISKNIITNEKEKQVLESLELLMFFFYNNLHKNNSYISPSESHFQRELFRNLLENINLLENQSNINKIEFLKKKHEFLQSLNSQNWNNRDISYPERNNSNFDEKIYKTINNKKFKDENIIIVESTFKKIYMAYKKKDGLEDVFKNTVEKIDSIISNSFFIIDYFSLEKLKIKINQKKIKEIQTQINDKKIQQSLKNLFEIITDKEELTFNTQEEISLLPKLSEAIKHIIEL